MVAQRQEGERLAAVQKERGAAWEATKAAKEAALCD